MFLVQADGPEKSYPKMSGAVHDTWIEHTFNRLPDVQWQSQPLFRSLVSH